MITDPAKTVREVAVEVPGATRVFEKFGIDYCCGGSATLRDACARAGITIDEVNQAMDGGSEEAAPIPDVDWATAPLTGLTSYIIAKHHTFTSEELNRLGLLLGKVCSVHGANHPEMLRIQDLFASLTRELLPHMMKEERVLFPYIDEMDEAVRSNRAKPHPFFGTVQNPIRMMMQEHETAGEVLRQIREASNNFAVPSDACFSFQTLYPALEAFEADLHQHIHLENNILFPRAAEMESA
ncbi:MAG TPA: iron-sulfur cluster repair di-iron protein [Blastocatellia bacterium]|nr:iron-sulfur cluster repair di-iron protein [Blastocatellia bacterium]